MDLNVKDKVKELVGKVETATDEENEKEMWDKALDLVETIVEATPTRLDDFIVKPLIGIIRKRFNIPDGND